MLPKHLLKAFSRQNMPDKSLSTAVATLILMSSGVGFASEKSKEELLAAAIGAAVSIILFFVKDRPAPKCELPAPKDDAEPSN